MHRTLSKYVVEISDKGTLPIVNTPPMRFLERTPKMLAKKRTRRTPRSLKFDGSIRILSDILRVRKFSIVALQEVGWIGAEEIQAYTRIGCKIYQSRGENRRLGTAFIVLGEMRDRVIGWTPLTDRMCVLRVKGRFFNISIINVHSPHSGSEDDDKDAFYEQLNWTYNSCPKHDVKVVIGDFNAQVGQEEEFRPVIGKFSAHVRTN
ncbi:craniofacial development protein 2-like [Culex quinquefasciatus]|uniref:craniofacial development protein 2-like n=1 Tax=Culex quinquefasciatus TaxID=7176 RepID=UPI0018E3E980|nr:craniofacial development protein 2-like [Culex quinquefasciatus]